MIGALVRNSGDARHGRAFKPRASASEERQYESCKFEDAVDCNKWILGRVSHWIQSRGFGFISCCNRTVFCMGS
eukprot:5443045-Karenia_brevis.AAC.1